MTAVNYNTVIRHLSQHIEPKRFHLTKGCFINFYRFQRWTHRFL